MPIVTSPSEKYKKSFLKAVSVHKASNEKDGLFDAHEEGWFEEHFDALMEKYENEAQGKVEEGRVPSTQFWVVEGDEWLGRFSLRHTLNDALKTYGGHLGYYLIPSVRQKGIGTWAMKEVLQEAKKLGLEKILVTCDPDNIGSQKLIQKVGGIHQDTVDAKQHNGPIMRWWIDLTNI